MKNILSQLKLLLCWCFGVLFTACNSLDLSPEDYFAEGNYWKNEAQVNSYMISMHKVFRDKTETLFWLGEPRAKIMRTGTSSMGVSINNGNIINSTLSQASPGYSDWAKIYENIFHCNLFIQKTEGMTEDVIPVATKNRYLGQVYGMRAYFYFTLLKTFQGTSPSGVKLGVPIITEPRIITETNLNNLYTPRATYEATLNFIKEDLKKSDDYYADDDFSTVKGRCFWSKGATKTLIGEVYLWSAKVGQSTINTADLNTALNALNSLPSSKYKLKDLFLDVFTYNNKGNDEIIFALNYDYNSFMSDMNYVPYMVYAAAAWGGYQTYDKKIIAGDTLDLAGIGIQRLEYKWELFEKYEDNDSRKRSNFFDFYKWNKDDGTLSLKTFVQRKYLGNKENGVRRFCDDYIIYRYADVLLMIAEIKNALGQDPSIEINKVRERAYRDKNGIAQPYPAYTNADFKTNEIAIYFERVKEMVMEGKAWYDLIRMQSSPGVSLVFDAEATLEGTTSVLLPSESYKLGWPISNSVLSADQLIEPNTGFPAF